MENKSLCRFFIAGNCNRGDACRYRHPQISSTTTSPPNNQINVEALPYVPNVLQATRLCKFFTHGGKCWFGTSCRFSHNLAQIDEVNNLEDSVQHLSISTARANGVLGIHQQTKVKKEVDRNLERVIHGATVVFGPGAEVKSVQLPSDFSTVQVLGLSDSANSRVITELLNALGFNVKEDQIQLSKMGSMMQLVATIRFNHPNLAKQIVAKFQAEMGQTHSGEFTVKEILPQARFGNWLQLNTVTISWFKASRKAELIYDEPSKLVLTKIILDRTRTPMGRLLQCTPLEPSIWHIKRNRYTLIVYNLDLNLDSQWIMRVLRYARDLPTEIKIVPSPYEVENNESANIVKSLLTSIGSLESFEVHDDPNDIKLRATAAFLHIPHATQAAKILDSTQHEGLGKLSVKLVSFAKFNIPNKIARALAESLRELQPWFEIEQDLKVSMSSFLQSDKPYVTLRFSGIGSDSPKKVAIAKNEVESLLAGTVIQDENKALWHSYFGGPECLPFLAKVSAENCVYIHRDLSTSHLILYGGNEDSRKAVNNALLKKKQQLSHGEKETGFTTKGIGPVECVVCLTEEGQNGILFNCGHAYCQSCFFHQASSANEASIPLHCIGDSANCKRVFTLEDLRSILSFEILKNLFEASLKVYIRTHPTEYAYCPTPDCTSMYRVSSDPADTANGVFFCTKCMTTSCKRCNATHDGRMCAEHRAALDNAQMEAYETAHGIKKCPQCKTRIEKTEGCDHMTCRGCEAHMCWVCTMVYDSAEECYRHLADVYGGIGLDEDEEVELYD